MSETVIDWKEGRGQLALFNSLMGTWRAEVDSPMGKGLCTRTIQPALSDKFIQINSLWELENGSFEELELIGKDLQGVVNYWNITSDGKFAQGHLVDASAAHPGAVGFAAPAASGKIRTLYWPEPDGFTWVVETQVGPGWTRLKEHRYSRQGGKD